MAICLINPLQDDRWEELVERHSRASAFHARGWLEALNRTYGYQPLALVKSGDSSKLEGGIAFCRVSSWLTGSRLVSLPFSDHCEPLVDDRSLQDLLVEGARSYVDREALKYLELRPGSLSQEQFSGLGASETFWRHEL